MSENDQDHRSTYHHGDLRSSLMQLARVHIREVGMEKLSLRALARDAGVLVREHGFRLTSAGAMDMFPQTSHVEAMALFERDIP